MVSEPHCNVSLYAVLNGVLSATGLRFSSTFPFPQIVLFFLVAAGGWDMGELRQVDEELTPVPIDWRPDRTARLSI
jgi:hypothetical protein